MREAQFRFGSDYDGDLALYAVKGTPREVWEQVQVAAVSADGTRKAIPPDESFWVYTSPTAAGWYVEYECHIEYRHSPDETCTVVHPRNGMWCHGPCSVCGETFPRT